MKLSLVTLLVMTTALASPAQDLANGAGNFYRFSDIETISPRPLLFFTGDHAHSKKFSEEAYRLAGEPNELVIIPGAGHVDLYDRTKLIPWDKLVSFFTKILK